MFRKRFTGLRSAPTRRLPAKALLADDQNI